MKAWDVIALVYALGTAYQAPRILKRWSLITNCDPIQLRDACRDERREAMRDADHYEMWDVFESALTVVGAAIWHIRPLLPASRKALGKDSLARCSNGTCLAHTGKAAA
ncbi:hypothetical protein AB0J43_02095 [Nonomuraea fuscirosea]